MKFFATALIALSVAGSNAMADQRTILDPSTSSLAAVGTLRGTTPEGTWVGGAVAIFQNHCYVAISTAGHNIRDGRGNPTTPLKNINVRLAGRTLPAIEAVMDPSHISTHPPEHDWAIVIAQKPTCGTDFAVIPPKALHTHNIPSDGMPVAMACYHHDRAELLNQLSGQDCTLYTPGTQFDGLYAGKSGKPVGLHSCTAKLGTSGCPLITKTQNQTYFVGTQIEAHYITGAGVARLFSGEFQHAFNRALTRMGRLLRNRTQLSAN